VFSGYGETFEGEYIDDFRNGPGKKTFANGTIYEGQCKDGVFIPGGTFYFIDGTVIIYNKEEFPISFMGYAEFYNLMFNYKTEQLADKLLINQLRGKDLHYLTDMEMGQYAVCEKDEVILRKLITKAKKRNRRF